MSRGPRPPRSRSRARRLFPALTLALVVLTTLGLGELLVRLFFRYNTPDTVRTDSLQFRESVYTRNLLLPDQRPDPAKAWGLRRGEEPPAASYVINEHGFRGSSFAIEKPPGVRRVVVLGGSAAFDVTASPGRDWPHLVEQLLHAAGHRDVQVINAGVPGYSSADSLGRLFSEIWMLEPDYLLLYNAWNDIKYFRWLSREASLGELTRPFRAGEDPLRYYRGALDRLLSFSQLYVKLRTRYFLRKTRVGSEGALPEQGLASGSYPLGLAQYRTNVSIFVEASELIGAVPVLITQATLVTAELGEEHRPRIVYRYAGLEHRALADAFASCRDVLLTLADEKGVDLIDAADSLDGRHELFEDHVHTTARGSELLAELVADHLAGLLSQGPAGS